jgi:hypothetical protein
MLLLGDSGSGKTGALASLVKAGYKLKIVDFDNGLDILAKMLEKTPELLSRAEYITCTDKWKSVSGKIMIDGQPKAWAKGMNALDKWEDGTSAKDWERDTVLVLDSLTFAGQAALRNALFLNGRAGQQAQIQDWGAAMSAIEDLLALLYSDSIKCNVIVISHITFVERDDGLNKGYPSALGNKLPPKVGRYFNSILLAKSVGQGTAAKRVIKTSSEGLVELKHPVPGSLPNELPVETGLATFFEAVCGKLGTSKA